MAIDHDYQLKLMEIKLKELEMKRKFTDDENDKLKASVKRLEEENELLRGRNMELDAVTSRKLVKLFALKIRKKIYSRKNQLFSFSISAINRVTIETFTRAGIVL